MDRCNNVEQRKHSVIMQSRCCDFMQVRQDYGLGRPCSRSCNGLDTACGSYQCLIFPAHDIHQVDYAHQAFSHTKYRFNGRYAHVQSSRARGLSAELAFVLSDLLARSKSNSGSHNRRLFGDPTRVGGQMTMASRRVVRSSISSANLQHHSSLQASGLPHISSSGVRCRNSSLVSMIQV